MLIPWTIMLFYENTGPYDIVYILLFKDKIVIRDAFNIKRKLIPYIVM
jgi:hypothetical protein